MRVISKGITKLSALTIDAAKDWQGKDITNLGVISPAQITDGVLIGPKVRIDSVLQLRDLADGDYQSLVAKIIVPTGDIIPLNDQVQSLGSATNNFLDLFMKGDLNGVSDIGSAILPIEDLFMKGSLNVFPLVQQTESVLVAKEDVSQPIGLLADSMGNGLRVRCGVKLTLVNKKPRRIGFYLRKVDNPTDNYYFRVRKVSDDSVIMEHDMGLAINLLTTETLIYYDWPEANWVNINEEVRIAVEWTGDSAIGHIRPSYENSNLVPDQVYCSYIVGTGWTDFAARDAKYTLIYGGLVALCRFT